MLLIWGFKSYVTLLAAGNLVCGRCGNPAAHRLHQRRNKFTFFWIPLFTTSTKNILECTFCGQQTVLSQQEADECTARLNAAYQAPQPGAPNDQQPPAYQPYEPPKH
jgi:hypothetical protein